MCLRRRVLGEPRSGRPCLSELPSPRTPNPLLNWEIGCTQIPSAFSLQIRCRMKRQERLYPRKTTTWKEELVSMAGAVWNDLPPALARPPATVRFTLFHRCVIIHPLNKYLLLIQESATKICKFGNCCKPKTLHAPALSY